MFNNTSKDIAADIQSHSAVLPTGKFKFGQKFRSPAQEAQNRQIRHWLTVIKA